MDLARIKAALEVRYAENPDDRRVLRVLRRVRRTLDNRTRAARKNSDNALATAQAFAKGMKRELIRAIESGERIVALDAEWSRDGSRHITEIGIATYQAGVLSTRNIRIIPDYFPANDHFFGTTEFMTDDEALAVLTEVQAGADLIAGHALRNDRLQLQRWRNFNLRVDRQFDTQSYGKTEYRQVLSLSDLLIMLDVMPKKMHSAGNDAFYVVMAMLSIAGRLDEVRAFGGGEVDLKVHGHAVRKRERAKLKEKADLSNRQTDEERDRKRRAGLPMSAIRVGASYLGRDLDDWPRKVERIVDERCRKAPSGRQTMVYFRKKNGNEKHLSINNFAQWAIEEEGQ